MPTSSRWSRPRAPRRGSVRNSACSGSTTPTSDSWWRTRGCFPPAIAETIRFHHDPAQASTDRGLCATVSLANSLCVKAALGPDQQPDLDLETLLSATMLELDPDQLEELMQQHARIVRLVWSG